MKVLRKNGEIVEVNFEEQEGKKAFWHTSAHVLAQVEKIVSRKCLVTANHNISSSTFILNNQKNQGVTLGNLRMKGLQF